jgi:EAL domain-containing protein (putative c-di-GMP-specific phosphodiesterase class I)/GGDEF domain-containing protein
MNSVMEHFIETVNDSQQGAFGHVKEAAIAASLSLAIIGMWLAAQPHSFDFTTAVAGMSARLVSVACILRGVWRWRPQHRFVWWLLGARFVWSFFFTPIRDLWIRNWTWWQVDSAIGTMTYIVAAYYLVRRRTGFRDRFLWTDVAVISIGLMFVFFSYLGIPVAENGGAGISVDAIFAGIAFPSIDTVLIALILLLAFASAKERNGSLTLLLSAFTIVAAADLSALMARLNMLTMTRTRTFVPISLIFIGLIGIAALLPSMRRIDRGHGAHPKPWSVPRLSLIAVVFLVTLYRLMTWTPRGMQPSPLLAAAVLAGMFVLIVLRAFLAVGALETFNDHMLHLATHDPPTGLLNTAGLEEVYKRISSKEKSDSCYSLILVSLRELREIGQLWGHSLREELAVSSAQTLVAATQADGVLARIEIDQFALLTRTADQDAESVDRAAHRIAHSVRTIPSFQAKGIAPAFDIGIASGSRHLPLEVLLRAAESAASVAQMQGQGSIARYDSTIAAKDERQFKLLNLLRGAIGRNEFTLQYQPVIDLSNHRLAFYEALLRWSTFELGAISPGEFIPLAESSEAIEEITDWVLDTACQAVGTLPDLGGRPYRMSLNISARSLKRQGLARRVLRALSRHDVPATAICLELTERSLMEDPHGELDLLRTSGVSLAIDDFGTGYSNLAMLTKLNADTIKLDTSLMRAAESDCGLRVVLQSVLRPLSERGIKLVAEGLETRQQCSLAFEIGCHFGQGWFFGKPTSHLAISSQVRGERVMAGSN